MTETLVSSMLVTTTVRLAGLKVIPAGPKPTVTVGGVCPHPALVAALQVAPVLDHGVPHGGRIPEARGIGMSSDMIDATVGRGPWSLVADCLNRRQAMVWIRAETAGIVA